MYVPQHFSLRLKPVIEVVTIGVLLQKDLGERLLPAFKSASPVPYSDVNLQTHMAHSPPWGPDSSTSEVTTIQLEFRYLSQLTGDDRFKVSPLVFVLCYQRD